MNNNFQLSVERLDQLPATDIVLDPPSANATYKSATPSGATAKHPTPANPSTSTPSYAKPRVASFNVPPTSPSSSHSSTSPSTGYPSNRVRGRSAISSAVTATKAPRIIPNGSANAKYSYPDTANWFRAPEPDRSNMPTIRCLSTSPTSFRFQRSAARNASTMYATCHTQAKSSHHSSKSSATTTPSTTPCSTKKTGNDSKTTPTSKTADAEPTSYTRQAAKGASTPDSCAPNYFRP